MRDALLYANVGEASSLTLMSPPSMADRHDRKTLALVEDIPTPSTILVVGCGDGREAGVLARHFRARTIGVGLEEARFDRATSAPATLHDMDARSLDFDDDSFDLVYSFHALEHIPGPEKALREMARVLVPGGHYIVGTPNKSRLLGSVTSQEPVKTRIMTNVRDYKMRVTGRWSNEAGAHAGFKRRELMRMCERHIGPAHDITDDYYVRLYPSRRRELALLRSSRLSTVAYPAVYVSGTVRSS